MILTSLFYRLLNWANRPSTATPLGQTNLNHMDKGIMACAQYIVQLSQDKAENSLVNQLVKSVVVDADTGVIIVTKQNGSVTQYDLDIEKVVLNLDINDQNQLVLTLADGTKKIVDLARFIYSVDSTATISMEMSGCTIKANIVNGSVTMEKLDAQIQTTFRTYMLEAQSARDEAITYSKDAERWAIGNETNYPGSEADNSKYYSQISKTEASKAKNEADRASMYADFVTPDFIVENNRLYINNNSTVKFAVYENKIYFKLPA